MNPKHFIYRSLFFLLRIVPIKRNKIVISSYDGKAYGDNGKYICDELISRGKDLDIVWLYSGEDRSSFPDNVRVVGYRSLRAIYELVTASVWIDNKRKKGYVLKRKKQFYIQTWHGGIGPKKVEKEAASQLTKEYVGWAVHDSAMADLFLAESEWTYDLYRRAFWYDGEIAKEGVPREDVLFNPSPAIRDKVIKSLGLPEDVCIVLYAPTFRENADDMSVYDIDWEKLLNALEERFGGKWIGMIRLHPNVSSYKELLKGRSGLVDATDYPDVQELLVAADCLITDYSSIIYEFGIQGRPAFIYAPDFSRYVRERELAISYDQLPFPLSYNIDELSEAVKSFNETGYNRKMSAFYSEYLRMYKGGGAAGYVADRIISRITEE